MTMDPEAWPNALEAQLVKIHVGFISVGVYFLYKIKWGLFRGVPKPKTVNKVNTPEWLVSNWQNTSY